MNNWVNAEEEFESWFSGKEHFVYKFEDARAVMGALKSRKVFVQGRPSDYLVTSNGVTFFAEVKSCENSTSFAFSNIQKAQWKCAIRMVAAKGLYFFYIRREPERIWYKVPGAFFVSLFNSDVKSVKWKDMDVYRCNGGH